MEREFEQLDVNEDGVIDKDEWEHLEVRDAHTRPLLKGQQTSTHRQEPPTPLFHRAMAPHHHAHGHFSDMGRCNLYSTLCRPVP